MNPLAKRLLLEFLDQLQYNLGNASCNDYELSLLIPDKQERREFVTKLMDDYATRSGDEDARLLDSDSDEIVNDGILLEWVISQVKDL